MENRNSKYNSREITIPLEKYAYDHTQEVINTLQQVGASPQFVIAFGSAVRGKK